MSDRPNVKIVLSAVGRGYVEIDGVRQRGVRGVAVHSQLNEATTVTLEFIGANVEVEADEVDLDRLTETTDIESEFRTYRFAQ